MQHIFIVNPTAGKGKVQNEIVKQIEEYFADAQNYKIYITKKAGEGKEIAEREVKTGEPIRFYACGGEGTVFEILNGIIGYDNVSLATIPCGSANDFLKFFGDKELFLDIKEMVEGEPIFIDLIKANEFYCINQCSVGMDAIVAREMQKFKTWPLVSGSMAYKLAVIKVFFGKVGLKIKIMVDDIDKGIKDCLFAVCANGPVYGGGYTSAPYASPFDKKLDWLIVENMPKLEILSYLKKYEAGTHIGLKCCEYANCTNMEISADKPFPLNLDGEIIMRDNVRFELVSKAMQFIVPKSVAEKFKAGQDFSQKDLILNIK